MFNSIYFNGNEYKEMWLNGNKIWEKDSGGSDDYSDADCVITYYNESTSAVTKEFEPIDIMLPYSINGTKTTTFSFPATTETKVKLVNLKPTTGASTTFYPVNYEKLYLPNLTDLSYLFAYFCRDTSRTYSWSPQNFTFSNNVTNMSNMFYYAYQLTTEMFEQLLPYFPNTSNVTTMANMFRGCMVLTSLNLSSWDISKVTSLTNMFYYCLDLETLDVSTWNTSSVTSYGSMFNLVEDATIYIGNGWNLGTTSNFAGGSDNTFINVDAEVYGDINVSTTDLYVTEGISDSTLGVWLSQSPTNTQTVTYSYTSDYVTSWSDTLTFDSTNYDVPQYIAFTPALDGIYEQRTDTIFLSSDNVENVSVSVFVTNTEQENTGGGDTGDTGSLARESLSTWSSDLQYYDIYTPISTKNINNMTLTTDSANRSFKMYCNTDYNKYGGAIATLSLPFQTDKFYKVSLKLRGKFGGTYSRKKSGVVSFKTYPYATIGINADNLSETSYSQYDFVIAVTDSTSMKLDLKLYNGVSTTGTSYGNYTLAGDWIEIKDFMFKEYDALPSIPKNTIYNGFTYETLTNISIGNYTSSSYASYSTDTTNNAIKYYCSTALSYGSTKTIVELEPCQKYEITGLARGTNGVGDIMTSSLLGDEVYLLYDNGITINETTYTEFTVYVDVDYTSYYYLIGDNFSYIGIDMTLRKDITSIVANSFIEIKDLVIKPMLSVVDKD